MNIAELLLIAVGLSADAFAVSVTNGMCMKNVKKGWTFLIALTFGVFQGIMPLLGYFLGSTVSSFITKYDGITALVLLSFVGGKMVFEGVSKHRHPDEKKETLMTFSILMVQGIATSIDALAVGVSFAAVDVNIVFSALVICAVTFVFSLAAVLVGKKFGDLLNKKAEIVGGLILIGIGLKIFLEGVF